MSEPAGSRVSTLELFFDLVFVFTITQLTSVLHADPSAGGLLRVVLMLGVIWWMYGGYAWLTNAVAPDSTTRRLLLLGGMSAFLVLALTIPRAFTDGGQAFGLAYLAVVAVHSFMFSRSTGGGGGRAILRIAPYNAVAALLLVLGGAIGGRVQYVLWTLALVVAVVPARLNAARGFAIEPAHFVERHGLVVLIAIGESVVAVGAGANGSPIDASLAAVAVLGLLLSACLWWTYLGGDDGRAEKALGAADSSRRPMLALDGYGYAHFLLLLGVVLTASTLRDVVRHAGTTLSEPRALALGGGVTVFLLGDAYFRRVLAIGPRGWRLAAAVPALATVMLGVVVSAVAQLTALIAVLVAAFTLEYAAACRAPGDDRQAATGSDD